jgi:predicted dehydrogenase
MRESIPVAVVGCGHLGTFHARLYAQLPEAQLVAVVDTHVERAQALAREVGVEASTDLAAILPRVRAVSIATPTTTHHDIAWQCLDAGVACLVEKPICESAPQGRALVDHARNLGLALAVGHTERFNPAFAAARAELGRPRFIESHRLAPFVARSLDVDVVLDLMIHDIDLTLCLQPAAIESVDAVGVPVLTPGADIANARIRFADGAVANLTASRVSRDKVRKIRFFGPRQYHSIDLMSGSVERAMLRELENGGITRVLSSGGPGLRAASSNAPSSAAPSSNAPSSAAPSSNVPASSARQSGAPALPAPASVEAAALDAYLAARHLRLDYGGLPVTPGNALLEELRDFLGAVRGGVEMRGADGEAGLRNLELAQRIRAEVARSLDRLGVVPPAPLK